MSTRFRRMRIKVHDLETTSRFYRDALKVDLRREGDDHLVLSTGGMEIEFSRVLDPGNRSHLFYPWVAELEIDAFDQAVADLVKAGAYFLVRPSPDEDGRIRAVVLDPSGHPLILRPRAT
jgi:hypothetical protein